ncbi:protein brambleberry-like [Daphnia pulex]|uniref:protein brambleberry-like n=1 Tax=Daphnia pulex TaxID=6669 RepID=UPI001EE102F7|nr:protein brambleberry-like [Daphnia pulex]
MKITLYLVAIILLGTGSHSSLVGWILGRDSSPFNILSSEKQFDKLMAVAKEDDKIEVSEPDESAVQARSDIPFELSVADEKFIADAQKYTDLSLSELDVCQHKLILQLKQDCNDLSEEDLSKLGVNLLNCQSRLEGRRVYPCSSSMTLRECTSDMDSDTWNAYHILSNRARSVCYGARQQQFRALTQMTVNKLMASSSQQLGFIRELKAEQEELGSLAADTLTSLTKGQEKLLEQQDFLKATQQLASQQISSTMREVSRERAAAFASQRQLASLSDSLKETLNQAAQVAMEQENDRKIAQQHLMDSLLNIEGHVGEVWNQLEESVSKLLSQQDYAAHMQSETIETLQKLNHTFQFLLSVSENSRDQLNWIQSLVVNTEKKVGKLSTWVLHVCYFLLGMLLLAFVQAPAYMRWIFLFLVPINLTMDLQQGVSMDAPALVGLLFVFSLGYRVFLFLKSRCSSGSASTTKQQEIQYRCSTPDAKSFGSVSDKSIEDLLNGCTLINDTFDGDRTPLPSPSFDKLLTHQKHKSVRSILQDTMQDDASFASNVHRRSPRRAPSSNSFRDLSPTRSVVSNVSLSQSRSGTPRRPSTPRRNCSGKCLDGSSCRNAATKDSLFCWQHAEQHK